MSDEKDYYAAPSANVDPDSDPLVGGDLKRPIGLFFTVLVLFVVVQVAIQGLGTDARISIMLAQIVVIFGGALAYRRFFSKPKTKWPNLKKTGMSIWAMGVVIVASVVVGLLSNLLGGLTIELVPGLKELAEQYQQGMERLLLTENLSEQILGAVAIVVVAPVCEEFLFRGTILPEQRRSQYAAGAVLLNGILFSAMHLNPVGFVSLAVIGCYFAHVTLRSGSLWGSILGHAALNLFNGVILLRLAGDLGSPDEIGLLQILGGLALLLPLTALLWWLSIRLIRGSKSEAQSSSR